MYVVGTVTETTWNPIYDGDEFGMGFNVRAFPTRSEAEAFAAQHARHATMRVFKLVEVEG